MKILIVDDHPVFREGIAALFEKAVDGTVVEQANTVAQALRYVAEHPDVDVVLLDLLIPGATGLTAISEFGAARKDLPVIVLSSSENPRHVREALSLGALGYVPKSSNPQTLLSAVKLVMGGDLYVPPLVLEQMQFDTAAAGPGASVKHLLTDRQVDVLRLIAQGLPNKTIASRLDLSEKTVKAHISSIFKTLNVVNRTQAAAIGRDAGLF